MDLNADTPPVISSLAKKGISDGRWVDLEEAFATGARIGRPDILWSVHKLGRAATKWTRACDRRLAHLISYIHHTSDYRQYCHVGNTAQQCRLELFQDSDFARDLEDSKSTSGGILCIFGSHTFVPTSWMCEKQTSVSKLFLLMQVYAGMEFRSRPLGLGY